MPNRIHECGLEVADIKRWAEIIKMAGGDDTAKAFIDMVYRIQDAQEETGLTIDEIDNKLQELDVPPKNCTSYNVRKTKPAKRGDLDGKEKLHTGTDYQ